MHALGTLDDGRWGYVRGGTGRVSFALADAAIEHGAVLATGVEVGGDRAGCRGAAGRRRADPGGGRRLQRRPQAHHRRLCASEVPAAWRERVAAWRSSSPVLKINCALSTGCRSSRPRRAATCPPRDGHASPSGIDATQEAFERAVRRASPAPSWAEVYFPSAYDPHASPPAGRHVMSVFAQYVPVRRSPTGTWDARRDEIADAALAEVARFAPDVADCVVAPRGARPARRRGPHRAHRRPHLPGRLPARTRCATAASPRAPPSPGSTSAAPPPTRGQRDRGQRPQRRDGRAGRRDRLTSNGKMSV